MVFRDSAVEFLSGYFSTNDRGSKTKAAYSTDLSQFQAFAGAELPLLSLTGALIERWAAHLRSDGYAPSSIRRKMAALKVFSSYQSLRLACEPRQGSPARTPNTCGIGVIVMYWVKCSDQIIKFFLAAHDEPLSRSSRSSGLDCDQYCRAAHPYTVIHRRHAS